VYLPPQAQIDPTRRFPTIYYLPGLGGDNNAFTVGNQSILDNLIANYQIIPSILVTVDPSLPNGIAADGRRLYEGTWYVNSALNGNFEDFFVKDLIPYVDAHYPTLPYPQFRAVVGQSMGGYGSLYLGITHPELFCGFGSASGTPFWIISDDAALVAPPQPEPGLSMFTLNSLVIPEIPTEGPNAGKVTPDNGNFSFSVFSYAAAFSPNVNKPPYYVELPFEVDKNNVALFVDGPFYIRSVLNGDDIFIGKSLIPRPEIIALWKSKDPYFLLDKYAKTAAKQAIYIDGGNTELINSAGARVISDKMCDEGVPNEYFLYYGGHDTCLTSGPCSRDKTMFQKMSAQFALAGLFPDDIRTKIVGNGAILLKGNASWLIPNGTIVGIETSPSLNITDTAISITVTDQASLDLGTSTVEGGVLQCGNRFTKAQIQGDPSLAQDRISAQFIVDGPQAQFQLGRKGVFGLGAGVDGKNTTHLNQASITTLTNLDNVTFTLNEGTFLGNIIDSGQTENDSLFLIGQSTLYNVTINPAKAILFGGTNVVVAADCLQRLPVVLDTAGVDLAGGIRNNLDTNPNEVDYFFGTLISSYIYYYNINNLGTLISSRELPDKYRAVGNPYTLVNGTTIDAMQNFLSINDDDNYQNGAITFKAGAVAQIDGTVYVTYNDNGTIMRVPAAHIPIYPGQNIDLVSIAQKTGIVQIILGTIDGNSTIIRINDPYA